jgi:hypothetical protein
MMEREMEKRVATIVSRQRKALEEQTGIQPAVDEVELKQYLHDVLEEISKKRATKA